MTSMISLIVVLLAAYAYSAPVVPEFHNATLIMQVENATVGIDAENVTVFPREQTSEDKRGLVTVGLSSSSEESSETTDRPSEREVDDSFASEDTKRGIEVESFETSTAEETSVPAESQVEKVKRSSGNPSWLEDSENMPVKKRSADDDESFNSADERSIEEDSSVPSTSEMNNMKNEFGEVSLTTEASEAFNRRAIGSVESVEAGELSTVITIRVHPESTTGEQPSSSTAEIIREASSSTSDYATTVVPVEESTTVASAVPSESTAKILAIIPGTISRTQFVVPPAEQMQLNQVRNETIIETKKPNY